MFVEAINKASSYTHPIIISNKHQDNSVSSGLGSFVIINEEGWFLTAAHIIIDTQNHHKHTQEYNNYINGNGMVINPKWILNHSIWLGADHHFTKQFVSIANNDLALGKIENYDPSFVKEYPRFVKPSDVKPGKTLCKLGFPFYDIQASFKNNAFHYDPKLFPIPKFPYEGMLTRTVNENNNIWIETSSPGLRGQSGGPIFDNQGRIWAIQSHTRHIPLGFSPTIEKNGVRIEENQFINLGYGIHTKAILDFLDKNKIRYYLDADVS